MKKILLAAAALLAVAIPAVATAAPANAAPRHGHADAAHSGPCISVRTWNKVRTNMGIAQVERITGKRVASHDGPADWFGDYGLMTKKYDVCGKYGHGYVDYYNDSDGFGWYVESKVLYQYI